MPKPKQNLTPAQISERYDYRIKSTPPLRMTEAEYKWLAEQAQNENLRLTAYMRAVLLENFHKKK